MDSNRVGCVDGGGVIETFSGRMFDVLNPRPELVHLPDIAHALSMICRFNGHCEQFMSVAQHCVYVERYVQSQVGSNEWETLLAALLHDASEAYLCDLARPIKVKVAGHWGYDEVEARVQDAVWNHYGVNYRPAIHAIVKQADNAVCRSEAWWLMRSKGREWDWGPTPMSGFKIEPVGPDEARGLFLSRVTYVWSKLKLERNAA